MDARLRQGREGVGPDRLVLCARRRRRVRAFRSARARGRRVRVLDGARPRRRAPRPPAILITIYWHVGSSQQILDRYEGSTLWAHEPAVKWIAKRAGYTNTFSQGDAPRRRRGATDAPYGGGCVLAPESHNATVGDTILGRDGRAHLCPPVGSARASPTTRSDVACSASWSCPRTVSCSRTAARPTRAPSKPDRGGARLRSLVVDGVASRLDARGRGAGWEQVVSSFALAAGGDLVLFDPLVDDWERSTASWPCMARRRS